MAKAAKDKQKNGTKKEINKVLITLPKPSTQKSPYFDLADKYGLELEFFPFIKVEGIDGKEFRKQRIDITEYTAIVFTSRKAIDHFFRICEELKVKVSQDMKYFCSTEAVALYLQKFILYRKRKVFFSPDGSNDGLLEVIAKHKNNEKFIVPTSDNGKNDIAQYLQGESAAYVEATLYRTLSNDIKPVMKADYDVIVFYSPNSVQTLFDNDPKFKQNGTLIGAFGPTTSKAIEDAGLTLNIKAPAPNAPSMIAALENYLDGK
ncbi:MAG: uroporphyrinogen-III synthase [Chitinophagales bacterium]|nr:uroporphyrinogen-III synthase [Chitinophagaceae bacterium]MCB9065152.1 uroporphyrinogen-III synthase [Chitinophagales bacterium]